MFQKIKFKFNNSVIQKCLFLTDKINTFRILEHEKLEDYVFFNYEEGSEEKYFCEKFEKQTKQKANRNGVSYDHRVVDFPYKKIIDHLPKFLINFEKPLVTWQIFGPNSSIPAHIDGNRLCSINFYLSVNDEKTIFYNKKRSGIKFKLMNGFVANESFLDEWLEEEDSFVAKKHDIYILNSSQPHSVLNTSDSCRISLQFSFSKLSYETVANIMRNYV